MALSVSATADLKVSPASFWATINKVEVIPKLMPQFVSSCEYIEGEGGVGSIRLMKFGPAVANIVTFSKEKVEEFDEERKKLSYSVIDGELLNLYKSYKVGIHVVQGDTPESCNVTWTLEYQPINPDLPPPDVAKQGAISTFKALEAYILNPTLDTTN